MDDMGEVIDFVKWKADREKHLLSEEDIAAVAAVIQHISDSIPVYTPGVSLVPDSNFISWPLIDEDRTVD